MYPAGEYDLAGFAVGVAEKSRLISGRDIVPGDVVLGLASSGPHSNGYSLVRKIVEVSGADLASDFHGRTLGETLLEPTRIYVKPLLALMKKLTVKGMAHITGGGITGNVPRVLPDNVTAVIDAKSWTWPVVFQWLQSQGNVELAEMHRTFNCGIGMVVVVASADADTALHFLREQGETVYRLGEIRARAAGQEQTLIV
jgi:phosphoribosylformylglycinamidine cyclo-ligase